MVRKHAGLIGRKGLRCLKGRRDLRLRMVHMDPMVRTIRARSRAALSHGRRRVRGWTVFWARYALAPQARGSRPSGGRRIRPVARASRLRAVWARSSPAWAVRSIRGAQRGQRVLRLRAAPVRRNTVWVARRLPVVPVRVRGTPARQVVRTPAIQARSTAVTRRVRGSRALTRSNTRPWFNRNPGDGAIGLSLRSPDLLAFHCCRSD